MGLMSQFSLSVGAALLAGACAAPAPPVMAGVPDRTEAEGRTLGPGPDTVRADVEAAIVRHFGAKARRQAASAGSYLLLAGTWGEFGAHIPIVLLARTGGKWTSWRSGEPEPLPEHVSFEIEQILGDASFWSEEAFSRYAECTGGAPAMIVAFEGRERIVRQACRPSGRAGRLTEIVMSIDLPEETARSK